MGTNYQDQVLDLLANQFCDADLFKRLNQKINLSYDNINDILEYLFLKLDVDTATGFTLDIIGVIVGQSRDIPGGIVLNFFGFQENADKAFGVARFWDGAEPLTSSTTLADAEYRTAILARIAFNFGDVSLPGVTNALSILYETTDIQVESRKNAELNVHILKNLTENEKELLNALNLVLRASGITVNTIVTSGFTVLKTGGLVVAWDAAAYSTESYSSGCTVRCGTSNNNTSKMIGLNTDPLTSVSFSDVDHALFLNSAGMIKIYNNNVLNPTNFGTYILNDYFEIEYDNANVYYKKNGEILHTINVGPGLTFFLDSSFWDLNTSDFVNIEFNELVNGIETQRPLTLVNHANTTITVT